MIKHVKPTRLSVCRGLAAAALGCLALSANAYQNLTPPAGWAAGGGAGGAVTGTKTAVNAIFSTGSMSTSASISVGGRAVSVPVTMRYAPTAARAAAIAVMAHPYTRAAAAVATWLSLASIFYDPATGQWQKPAESMPTPSDSSEFSTLIFPSAAHPGWHPSKQAACMAAAAIFPSIASYSHIEGDYCFFNHRDYGLMQTPFATRSKTCPSGWYISPAGCIQKPQPITVTPDQAADELTKYPMPAEVPRQVPAPLPVDLPEWQPLFIPTGNPVPNPNYKPNEAPSPTNQPYVQPGVKVEPAPSPGAPWQADVKPVNRPTASPTGSTEPSTESSSNPSNDTPRQDQKEDQDFCDKHKESIICAEADTPEQDLPTGKLDISYNYVDIFGNGSCPSDAYLSTHGMSLKVWDWAATCDNVQTYFRPVLIACCAFAAFVIVAAGGKE